MISSACERCGNALNTGSQFCSHACKYEARKQGRWNSCLSCRKPVWQTPFLAMRGWGVFCSKTCRHAYNRKPSVIRNGYRFVYAGRRESGSTIYRAEHRVIIEKMLGRELTADEIVHHKNGDKLDNRPDNLLLTVQSEHGKSTRFGAVFSVDCPHCHQTFGIEGGMDLALKLRGGEST